MEYLTSIFTSWFVLPSVLLALIYWFSTKNYRYWKNRGVPSVSTLPVLGSLFGTFSKATHETEIERYKKFGRIYGHYEGSRPVLNVADPDLVRNILVKDFQFFTNRRSAIMGDPVGDNMVNVVEGEAWKRLRTIITPTFTTGKIKRMVNIFEECARTLSQNFLEASKEGKSFDARQLYGAFSMDVIASASFSTKIDSHNDPNNRFVEMTRRTFNKNFNWRAVLLFLFPGLLKFFKIPIFNPVVVAFFKQVTLQIIDERKRTGQTRNDFLQLLMDTAKEEVTKAADSEEAVDKEKAIDGNYGAEEGSDLFHRHVVHKKSLSQDELVAQCVIFFLAGHSTTALTLSFTSYNLALNPKVQETLIQEIDKAIREAGGEITYEAIQNMKYLDNVISESLRMFPPALRLERRAESDYQLGDTGITVPKDMLIGIPAYAMHWDDEFFPDPDKFDPDRFSAEGKSNRPPYTYLPFGAGPRNCIGMRFALMEVKVCLAYVLSHFRLKRSPLTKVPLDYYIGSNLLQPKEVPLMVEVRKDGILKL